MATVYVDLPAIVWLPASSNGATQRVLSGTPDIPVLSFAGASTDNTAYTTVALRNYGSGNLTLTVEWTGDTDTTGNVVRWGAAIAVITPNTDSTAVGSPSFGTAVEVNDTHLGTTATRVHTVDITGLTASGLADGDMLFIQLYREASDTGNDTYADEAYVPRCVLSYSDT